MYNAAHDAEDAGKGNPPRPEKEKKEEGVFMCQPDILCSYIQSQPKPNTFAYGTK